MEKYYSVFNLFVITIDEQKFICECIVPDKKYQEVLTRKKINFDKIAKFEKLCDYYPLLAIMNYKTKEPLMLTKNNILQKYIAINSKEEETEFYKEPTTLASVIDDVVEQPDIFYKMIGESITPAEREYIKSLLSKDCDTCANSCCRVEQVDKPINDCIGWENNRIIGQYKVLKLNRKTK